MTDECGEYCQPPLQIQEEGVAAVNYARVAENQTLNGDQQTEICELTAGQSASVHWKCVRQFRLTASNFGRIVSRRATTAPDNLLKSLLYPKDISHLPAVRFGNQNEPNAVRQYLAKLAGRNIQVSEAGFYVCCQQGLGYLGASPDRLVKDLDSKTSYILEIKSFCDSDPDIRTLAQLARKRGGNFCCRLADAAAGRWVINKNSACYHQILGQMAMVGVCFCDLVLSFKDDIAVARVFYDLDAWAEDCEKLKRFYIDAFLPEVHLKKIKNTMP